MKIEKYSFGIGDRFGMEGRAQLSALLRGKELGIEIVPVWNKSNREHQIIGTNPVDVRKEAAEAVAAHDYKGSFYVDADHINADSVDRFIEPSDFFTLDVAAYIGKSASKTDIDAARAYLNKYAGELLIPGMDEPFSIGTENLEQILNQYLLAVQSAGKLYSKICNLKGEDNFIAEVSMDEVEIPQSPMELFLILALIAREGIKVQTIAPKFSGRFNKGVDYVGDPEEFRKEFESDLLVIKHAIKEFDLPDNLKLSIHSGSDKFSIYPIIGEAIVKHDMGIHVKTAGTTWLEELIGLAMGDRPSIRLAKDIYREALVRIDELCGPYADVIDININKLPRAAIVDKWTGAQLADSIRHIPENPSYNMNMRQLMHVAYKLAAERGTDYTDAVRRNADIIGLQVEENIFERHLKRLFVK